MKAFFVVAVKNFDTNIDNIADFVLIAKNSITKALPQNTLILYWAVLTPQLRLQFYH